MGDAIGILLVNGRVLALVAGATILAWTTPRAGVWLAAMLTAIAALNIALISVAIADSGVPAVLALAPHAPLEMLAYSLAGAGFLHVRRRATAAQARPTIALFAAAGGVLTIAAAVEVTPLWSVT